MIKYKKKFTNFFSLFLLLGSIIASSYTIFNPQPVFANPPANFTNEILVTNLTEPTGLTFTPDGRMLTIERAGRILVTPAGSTTPLGAPLNQLTNINTSDGERGLVGIAIDPNFTSNNYYYVFYTADSPLRDRVSRFTASGNTTLAGSEVVLWQEPTQASLWHHGGTIAFGPDGKLYISTGDGFDTNSGSNHVSQILTSTRGKILRINSDGTIPSDNPFNDGVGSNFDEIWARGLRNPFRFSFDSVNGDMYIGDVGGNSTVSSIEEVNRGAVGANFGWPICEGTCGTSGMTNPIYVYTHGGRDASVTGGFVYRGSLFPSEYQGTYFFGDYVRNWIRQLTFNTNGSVSGSLNFEPTNGTEDGPYGEIVDIKMGPDGNIYYVDYGTTWEGQSNPGKIRRVKYTGTTNQPPVIANVTASPTSGPGPTLQTTFSVSASDPENNALTYSWNFGDSNTSTQPSPTHTYAQTGQYTARVTVSDGTNQTLSDSITITVGNPPTASILTPVNNQTFRAGDVISFSGTATDPDETLTNSAFSWRVVFNHESHIHPAAGPMDGITSGTYTIPTTGHDFSGSTSYDIILTITDSTGLQNTTSTRIYPEKVNLTFNTTPTGLGLDFDQETNLLAPFTRDTLINFQHTLVAPLTQSLGGSTYSFQSWSDGGSAQHIITAPATSQTYTAIYQQVASPTPTASPTSTPQANFSLDFDGTNDTSRTTQQIPGMTGSFTVEGWIYPETANQNGLVILHSDDNTGWSLELNSGRVTLWGSDTSGVWRSVQNSTVLAANTWYHVAATYDSVARTSRVYVNGSQGPSGNLGILSNGPFLRFGGFPGYSFFNGRLDEVRISNNIRYSAAFTRPTLEFTQDANTTALYHFTEGLGQNAQNATSSSYAMTLGTTTAVETSDPLWSSSVPPITGVSPTPTASPSPTVTPSPTPTSSPTITPTPTPTPSVTPSPTINPTPTPTIEPTASPTITPTPTPTASPSPTPTVTPTPSSTPVGTTLQFNGDDYVQATNIPLATQYTYEAWVKRTSDTGSYETFLSDATSSYNRAMVTLFIDGGSNDCAGIADQFAYYEQRSNGSSTQCSGVTAQLNTWYHIAVSRDATGTRRYFVDGILTNTQTGTAAPTDSTGRLTFGRAGDSPSEYFRGRLDDIRIVNQAIYTANFTRPSESLTNISGTVGLWNVTAGTGQSLADTSGNNRNGRLGSSTSADAADPVWTADNPY